MAIRRIQRRLLFSYLILLVATFLPAAWLIAATLRSASHSDIREDLIREARILATAFDANPPADVPAWAVRFYPSKELRVTIVARDGHVVGDSEVAAIDLAELDNHASRPEIAAALRGQPGSDTRHSVSIRQGLMYVAVPLPSTGALRLAMPLDRVARLTDRAYDALIAAGALACFVAIVLGYALTRLITRPVIEMTHAAVAMAEGVFTAPLPEPTNDELGDLSRALSRLSKQLAERLERLAAEREKLRSVLNGMTEGVVLVHDGVISVANPAFSALLAIPAAVEGRTPLEAARVPELADAIDAAATRRQPFKVEVSTAGRALEVHALPLGAPGAKQAVAVLLDVTDAKRLERVRRDFVANASHELRTPVAAILGAADTLADGAAEDPVARASFIGILQRHAQRLADLTKDLLDIARLESGYRPRLEAVPWMPVASSVFSSLRPRADQRRITLEDASQPVSVVADRAALDQIFTNLVDNAIKYTPEGGRVRIDTRVEDKRVLITVTDTGMGIPHEHLPRIFERFYRVDDARSRDLGGTGLGLAIARHLVRANDGDIRVESELGKGSRFIVTLQRA